MTIALVDDDKTFLNSIKSVLQTILREEDNLIHFENGIKFLNHFEGSRANAPLFDLILLDIKMPFVNGIQVGQVIRSHSPEVAIVYLTAYEGYCLQAMQVRPLDYLLKKHHKEKLHQIINEVRYRANKQDLFIIHFEGSVVSLPLGGIRYMESQGRKLIVHYGNVEYSTYYKIKDAEKELIDSGFIRVHRAFLVNTLHIVAVDRGNSVVRVTGGDPIYVSPKKISQVFTVFCKDRMKVPK